MKQKYKEILYRNTSNKILTTWNSVKTLGKPAKFLEND